MALREISRSPRRSSLKSSQRPYLSSYFSHYRSQMPRSTRLVRSPRQSSGAASHSETCGCSSSLRLLVLSRQDSSTGSHLTIRVSSQPISQLPSHRSHHKRLMVDVPPGASTINRLTLAHALATEYPHPKHPPSVVRTNYAALLAREPDSSASARTPELSSITLLR